MAIDKSLWKKAKAYFEAGKSLTYIAEKTGISRSQLSKKSKAEEWQKEKTKHLKDAVVELEAEKETLETKNETVRKQLSELEDYEVEILEELIEDESRVKSLLTNATVLNLVRINQALKQNTKVEKLGIGDGMQTFAEVGLGSGDYKQLQEAIDKASITLGVNQRHAPKTEIKNMNGQQNNYEAPEIEGYTVEVITPEQVAEAKRLQAREDD